jgi:hypothetical protein
MPNLDSKIKSNGRGNGHVVPEIDASAGSILETDQIEALAATAAKEATPGPISEPVAAPISEPVAEDVDIFSNLDKFRVSQDFVGLAAVKTELTEISVGKPGRQEFVRVHPDPAYRIDVAIIETEADRSVYLVMPNLANSILQPYVKVVTLFTTVNTQKVVYLWPISLPVEDRQNSWIDSARKCADDARSEWVQVKSNRAAHANRYEAVKPQSEPPAPVWPDVPLSHLLKLAFRDRLIDSLNHPVARRLLGITFD